MNGHTGRAGPWSHDLDTWTLDAWTLCFWTLDDWKFGLYTTGYLDYKLTFNNYTFATKEILQLETLISFYRNLFERMCICNCSLIIEKLLFDGRMIATVVAKLTPKETLKGWPQLLHERTITLNEKNWSNCSCDVTQ